MSRFQLKTDFESANTPESSQPGKPFMPFWLPEQGVDTELPEHVRTMDRKVLVNILNYLHFSDRSLLVHVQKNGNHGGHLLPVHPEPCLDGEVACRWPEPTPFDEIEETVRNLIIDDGKSMIVVPVTVTTKDKRSFASRLPDKSYVISRRQEKRYPCSEVSVEILTNEQTLHGELTDFSPTAFRVSLTEGYIFNQPLLKAGDHVNVDLRREETLFFSGTCTCFRVELVSGNLQVILYPMEEEAPVFEKRKIRNPRLHPNPPASVRFGHPLFKGNLQIEIFDICSSGFSVYQPPADNLLITGMVIPEMRIQYSGSTILVCTGKVVYSKKDGDKGIRSGLAIIDMEIDGYTRLNHLVNNFEDPDSQVSCQVDPDALWEFFFSTGFIYPKKYHSLYLHKQEFRDNCNKLYKDDSQIAHNFVCQKNGRIYGHISILKAYERTWLVHHHAGRPVGKGKSGGLMALRQVMHYFNDFYRLPSSGIEYALSFFRPENRFPRLIFGGFVRQLKDPQGCSMDLFSYLPLPTVSVAAGFRNGWSLGECTNSDRSILQRFYDKHSGGLLLDAMSIDKNREPAGPLGAMYSRYGLFRKMEVYSLRKGDQLVAVLIADYSNRGLNFSDALNCIKVIVIRQKDLPRTILYTAISRISRGYDIKKVPVMCYPSKYLETEGILCEKEYQLWVLKLTRIGDFMEFTQRRFRIS